METNCYKIESSEKLLSYLSRFGRGMLDCDYQLETNLGFVYELTNGEVVFIPNNMQTEAILYKSQECLKQTLNLDQFPIENPKKEMFELECERIKTFHLQGDYYKIHLNKTLKLDFKEINELEFQVYLKKVIGRSIRKLTTDIDTIALISVFGELAKKKTNGKWFLEKRYGDYNPIFEPNIVTSKKKVISVSWDIIGFIKWKVSKLETINYHLNPDNNLTMTFSEFSKTRKVEKLE